MKKIIYVFELILLVLICPSCEKDKDYSGWEPANNGLYDISVLGLTVDPVTNYIYAGTMQGGLYMSTDNGNSWTALNNGLLTEELSVPSIAISGSNIFAGTYGDVFLSIDDGSSWKSVLKGSGCNDLYVSSVAISGSNIYAGTAGKCGGEVYLSTNNGTSWTPLGKVSGIYGAREISSLAINDGNIFAGTHGAGIFLSTDNGTSWTAVNNGLSDNGLYVETITISSDNIFAGTSDGVFLSTNSGNSWKDKNNGLPGSEARSVRSIAVSGSTVFAGTFRSGVFLSTNHGRSWTSFNNGLSDIIESSAIWSIVISESNVFAGTSEGVWKCWKE